MKVLDLIKKAGAKAGLIQVQEEIREIEIKIVERKVISLAQLEATTETAEELKAPPPELTVGFDKIFEALNIPVPTHGWTADRVGEMLQSDELKSKNPTEAGQAVIATLGQNQVTPEDIIKDALARDQALDSYEEFVAKKIEHRASDRKKAAEGLLQQIRDLEKQASDLQKAQTRDEKSFQEWQKRKLEKEEELARVASLFVQEHGISVGKNKNQK